MKHAKDRSISDFILSLRLMISNAQTIRRKIEEIMEQPTTTEIHSVNDSFTDCINYVVSYLGRTIDTLKTLDGLLRSFDELQTKNKTIETKKAPPPAWLRRKMVYYTQTTATESSTGENEI